jgi:UDP-glucose 4-epimerase
VKVSPDVLRRAASLTWRLRLQPSPEGWLDMALGVPIMDSSRARDELGWTPRRSAGGALLELLAGMKDRSGADTPPLRPDAGGPLRVRELLTGLGGATR